MRVVPGYRCLGDEDVLADVVAINEAVGFLDVESFYGSDHSLLVVTSHVDESVLDVTGLPFAPHRGARMLLAAPVNLWVTSTSG